METITISRQERSPEHILERVVAVGAYEDFVTGARVSECCRSFSRDVGHDCKVIQQVWLVNLLRLPKLRAIAAEDAAAADLIIVSFHHADNLPEEVKKWIELCLERKGNRAVTLMALFDQGSGEVAGATREYLEEVARKGNMEVVVQLWELGESHHRN